MNRRILLLLVTASLFPAAAQALGIGRLHLESALNEPFEARIELLSPTREELDSLSIALADSEAFARAGVDRPFVLSQLRFEVIETEEGSDYIHVSSREPIREPFLNFLVEVSWSRGRLFREYTVLLDPPLYDPGVRSMAATPEPAREVATPVEPDYADDTGYETEPAPAPAAAPGYTGTEYGPTVATDTLWSIASAVRPDDGVSIQQMMLALVRANPEAFIDGNVNGLRRGVILNIPDRDEVVSLSTGEALAEVRAQYAAWQGVREAAASAPAERPDTSTEAGTAPAASSATVAEESPELRLVAPGDGASSDAAPGAGSGNEAALRDDLALAEEQLQALSQENVDLKDRLAETEAIVEDLKRLIALKDDELAELQRRTAGGAVPAETTAAPAGEEMPAAEPAPVSEAEEAPAPEMPEETPKAEPEKAAPPPPPPPPPEPSLLERVIGFITGNLPLVGGSLLAVVLLAGGLAFAARRRRAAAEDAIEAAGFGDFTGPETDLSAEDSDDGSEDITNIREDLDQVEAPDATMVAPPPARPAAEPASQQPAQPAESEEDPLAEVNVFLAYEHFDQAEEFVRDAITREPDNLDFHAKLLEVFYASGDRRKYEEAARVLHDKVGGSGPHWDSAVAMWSEMSPGRALFEAPAEGEEEAGPARGGAGAGVLDLTAAAGQGAEMGLDFDLGEATAEPAAPAQSTDEGILDLTAGNEEATAPSPPAAADEDILDVTAAVGLDTEPAAHAAAGADDVLDITGGQEAGTEDVLDVSSTSADDLLDVTAHSNVGDGELDGDPLDVTASTGPGTEEQPAEEPPAAAGDEHSLDFNLDVPVPEEPADGDNVIDFEPAAAPAEEEGGMELDLSGDAPAEPPQEDAGLSLDMGSDEDDSSGLELSLADDEEAPAEAPAEGGIELDLSTDEAEPDSGGLELELDAGDGNPAEADLEGTVEIPKIELELDVGDDEDDDDDDDQRTVFVPRSTDAEEQSAEDEMATKLDLAKAYVELGDKESAKSILDEVISGGTDKQRQKAQELISQIS